MADQTYLEQEHWRYCKKCRGLFFSGSKNENGVCPAGGAHDPVGSGNYILKEIP